MSKTKKFFLRFWQFISIFGLLLSYMFFLYARITRNRLKSEHKFILERIMHTKKPSIKDIQAVFEVWAYYDSSSIGELKKVWGANTQIMEKFKQYPSMIVCVMGDLIYFIFFNEEGKMADFIVDET